MIFRQIPVKFVDADRKITEVGAIELVGVEADRKLIDVRVRLAVTLAGEEEDLPVAVAIEVAGSDGADVFRGSRRVYPGR